MTFDAKNPDVFTAADLIYSGKLNRLAPEEFRKDQTNRLTDRQTLLFSSSMSESLLFKMSDFSLSFLIGLYVLAAASHVSLAADCCGCVNVVVLDHRSAEI